MVSPPIYIDGVYNISQKVVNDWFPIEIRNIAFELGIKDNVIDIFEALGGAQLDNWELVCDKSICDGCHPNGAGFQVIASTIYK